MSGFEIVSVVLGVLPLIVSAIEDYEKIMDPVITFRKYSKALQTFTTELNVQRDIFQNECIWILSRFVDGHDLENMLKDPSHHLRKILRDDGKLDGTVSKTLGPPYRQLRDVLVLITESLNEIYEETKDLSEALSRPPRTEAESVDFKAWRHHTKQKLKLSLTKPTLNKKIDDVRHRNQAFLAISQQIARFSISWSPNQSQRDLQYAEKNLEKIRKLRDASKTLYGHLQKLWLCPSHSEHSINLRLCLETSELYKDGFSKISFDMALTYHDQSVPSKQHRGPVLLAIESTAESTILVDNKGKSAVRFADKEPLEQIHTCQIQRQHSAGIERPAKSGFRKIFRKLKGDSGHEAGKALSPSSSVHDTKGQMPKGPVAQKTSTLTIRDWTKSAIEPAPPDLNAVSDLCYHILESSKTGTNHPKSCIGCLSGLGEDRYTVFRKITEGPGLGEMISLTNTICNSGRTHTLSKPEKWRVAGAISLAVLLYYSTPWLKSSFRSDDVLFIQSNDTESPQARIPHLHSLGRKSSLVASSKQTPDDGWVKNQMLYCLGVILLEIEFGDRLEDLIEWTRLPGTPQLDQPLMRQLQMLKRRSGEQLGTLYGRIVRMCLDCDFGLGLDEYTLQDPHVQRAFYSQVIVPFQESMPEYSKIWSDE